MRLILILTWSVAVLGIAAWLIAPMLAGGPAPHKKTILLMDSTLPEVVYDSRSRASGRTNADEIYDALKDVPSLSISKETTSLQWAREEYVRSLGPDLIILHLSAFYDKTTPHDGDRKLLSFLRYISSQKSRLLLYTRAPLLQSGPAQDAYSAELTRQIPALRNRVSMFRFENGQPMTFMDTTLARNLKLQVKSILGLE